MLEAIRRNVFPFPRDLVLLQAAIWYHPFYCEWNGVHDASNPGSRCGWVTDRAGTYQLPESKVIVCIVHPNPWMTEEAFATGPEGFVQKQPAHADLAAAIHAVHTGGRFVSYARHGGRKSQKLKIRQQVLTREVNDEGWAVKWTGEGERRANQASTQRREVGHDSHSGQ